MKNCNKARALLINPPIYDFALYDLFLKPFGLLRLGKMLEAAGWQTSFINAMDYNDLGTISKLSSVKRKSNGTGKFHRLNVALPKKLYGIERNFARYGILPEIFEKKIETSKFDVVFISSGMTYWYPGISEAVSLIKKHSPEAIVVVGGIYASLMPEHCYTHCLPDFVSTGRADSKLDDFLQRKGFPGIEYSANALPLDAPCWKEAAILRINEGCPFRCNYCASSKISPQFIPGAPEDVFLWMKNIMENHKTENFAFYDDALLVNAEKTIKPFLERVIEYKKENNCNINFYTPNALHVEYITQEIATLMKIAGFKDIRLGFESESEAFHAEYDNKYCKSSFDTAIEYLLKAGFAKNQITVYILAGLPRQKAADVEKTIKYAANKGITLSISEFSTVPGSSLWDECVKLSSYPISEEPLYHNNSFFPMEWAGFTREDMQRLKMLSKKKN